jgi:hypothetical protein
MLTLLFVHRVSFGIDFLILLILAENAGCKNNFAIVFAPTVKYHCDMGKKVALRAISGHS